MSDGIMAMIGQFYGGEESRAAMERAQGKEIESVMLIDEKLRLGFEGFVLVISDDGQSCCEERYMRTDDDLQYYVGATLLGFEVKDGPPAGDPDDDDVHEQQFLEVKTGVGVFTMASHVEHNGYYGGFAVTARVVE